MWVVFPRVVNSQTVISFNVIRAAFDPARTYAEVCNSKSNPWPVIALFTLVYAALRVALSTTDAFTQEEDWMYALGSSVGFLVRCLLLVYFIFLAGDRFQRMKITIGESARIVAFSLFPIALEPLLIGWLPWEYAQVAQWPVLFWSVWILATGLRVCKQLPIRVSLLVVIAAHFLIKLLSLVFIGMEL